MIPPLKLILILILSVSFSQCFSQDAGTPFPRPSPNFSPKQSYDVELAKASDLIVAALRANQIQVEFASGNTQQIVTEYRAGPSSGGSIVTGQLITQFRFSVFLEQLASSQTQILIKPTIQAKRLASPLGRVISGNNAISDLNWIDATNDNPDDVRQLQLWLYEQFEQRLSAHSSIPLGQRQATLPERTSSFRPTATDSLEIELDRLKSLRSRGVITESEYVQMRAKLLGLR